MRRYVIAVVIFSLVLAFVPQVVMARSGLLVFVETNDLQSQVMPFKARIGGKKMMVGGLARVATVVKEMRKLYGDKLVVVSGGDDLMGPFYLAFHGVPEYEAMDLVGYDVVTPGNHEFDLGPKVYAEALKHARFAVISTNMELDYPPFIGRIHKYRILKVGGLKVGFFGLMAPELPTISNVGDSVKVKTDLVKVARDAVKLLKKRGADVVIAVTHIGIERDIMLAKHVSGIAAILGGHSHTVVRDFHVVTGPGGWKTVVVQAGARAMYAGRLYLPIKDGRPVIDKTVWDLVLLDKRIKEDPTVMAYLKPFVAEMKKKMSTPVGVSKVPLDARKKSVRRKEANIGDFFADAMRWKFDADIALTNGGGIRGDRIYPAGKISYATLLALHPFGNTVVVFKLKGSDILKILEISASAVPYPGDHYSGTNRTPTGGFLQVSGIKVVYDLRKKPTLISPNGKLISWGHRVVKVEVKTKTGWKPLLPNKVYKVVTNSWLAHGGDKYFVFKSKKGYDTTVTLPDVLYAYIKHLGGSIAPKVDGRIVIEK